jgi:hypothetical protein
MMDLDRQIVLVSEESSENDEYDDYQNDDYSPDIISNYMNNIEYYHQPRNKLIINI